MSHTTTTTPIQPANLTRRTRDLPGKLRSEGRYGYLALYHLLRLSDLGREGIEHSGSFRFADHVYANRSSGRGVLGQAIDRILLSLPAARAMRQRCVAATAAMRRTYDADRGSGNSEPFRLLTAPCGLPRDVCDFADSIPSSGAGLPPLIEYTGLDLDPIVLAAARDCLAHAAVPAARWVQADALDPAAFPSGGFHFIGSTGLGEFLSDEQLGGFYANVYRALRPGGVFFTSATAREPRSDAMMRAFELHTHYRTRVDIAAQLERFRWRDVQWSQDRTGLQTFVSATKE